MQEFQKEIDIIAARNEDIDILFTFRLVQDTGETMYELKLTRSQLTPPGKKSGPE